MFKGVNIRDIIFSIFSRISLISLNIILAVLIAAFVDSEVQGLYFFLNSIVMLQVFADLGMSQIVAIVAARNNSSLAYNNLAKVRYISLWYGLFVGVGFLFVGLIIGLSLFYISNEFLLKFSTVYFVLILIVSINIIFAWVIPYLNGIGYILYTSKLRFVSSIISFFVFSLLLLFNHHSYLIVSIPVGVMFGNFVAILKIFRRYRFFYRKRQIKRSSLSWKSDFWNFQWRLGLSWIFGYFNFQMYVPIIAMFFGLVDAGRIGMSMAVFNAINSITNAILSVFGPKIANLLSRNVRDEAYILYLSTIKISLFFCFLSNVIFFVGFFIFQSYQVKFASLGILFLMSVGSYVQCIIQCSSVFLRSHQKEPMLKLSAVTSILSLMSIYLMAHFSIFYIYLATLFISSFIALPRTQALVRSFKNVE